MITSFQPLFPLGFLSFLTHFSLLSQGINEKAGSSLTGCGLWVISFLNGSISFFRAEDNLIFRRDGWQDIVSLLIYEKVFQVLSTPSLVLLVRNEETYFSLGASGEIFRSLQFPYNLLQQLNRKLLTTHLSVPFTHSTDSVSGPLIILRAHYG